MAAAADYDTDILAWSEQQAALLRSLARAAVPNALDLENIAEEIEDVGRSVLSLVESQLRIMLIHAIKAASRPEALPVRKWLAELAQARIEARAEYLPSMARRLDLNAAWRRAVKQATIQLEIRGDATLALQTDCPFTLDDLLDEGRPREWYSARLQALTGGD